MGAGASKDPGGWEGRAGLLWGRRPAAGEADATAGRAGAGDQRGGEPRDGGVDLEGIGEMGDYSAKGRVVLW